MEAYKIDSLIIITFFVEGLYTSSSQKNLTNFL